MEYEQIKRLMDDMGNSKLSMIDIEFPDGIKIKMEKKNIGETIIETKNLDIEKTEEIEKVENVGNKNEAKIEEIEEGNIVTSPMVGTFYIKPSPNSNPYVEIGSEVKKGDVLCIIEAMKLMNEIESDYDGEIVEICVNNEDMVDFGKVLFKIK